jgi:hypothetical protein
MRLAPSLANRRAHAAPIPELAPLMSARFPRKRVNPGPPPVSQGSYARG